MLEVGKVNHMVVKKLSSIGIYLASEYGEILMPAKYVPDGVYPGAEIQAFVYLDSEDRLIATTLRPKAQVGDFALLSVKDTNAVGAFLDWGLEKDLLVPYSEQIRPMQVGEAHLVRVYLDGSERIAASAKISKFLEPRAKGLKPGDEVEVQIYEFTDLGAKVIINGRYPGLLFKSELFGRYRVGDKTKGYVAKVREDGKIDLTLRKGGTQELAAGKEVVLGALRDSGGFLAVGDKSSPERIAELFRMSKKTFKTAIGNLYKEGVIEILPDGIRLR